MKYNDFELINGALFLCFESVLENNGFNVDAEDIFLFEHEGCFLFDFKENSAELNTTLSLNLQALNMYIDKTSSFNPFSKFMILEKENGLNAAMKIKKEFLVAFN